MPILTDPARFKVVCCGRRWGKTATCLPMIVRGHGSRRGQWRGALDGGNMLWVAPSYKILTRRIWPDLKRCLQTIWTDKSEGDHTIYLPGQGRIQAVSAHDPDGLVGDGYDGVVMDEAAYMQERAWREKLRPTLSDRGGWATFITTPNGQNWFYDLFQQADRDGWARWQRPTVENPLIPQPELDEALEAIGPRAFAQEYGGQFMNVAGAEWPADYFTPDVWTDEWPRDEDVRLRVVYLDPSLGATDRSDYSAFVSISLTWDGTLYVDADLERRDAFKIVTDGIAIYEATRPVAFGIESNGFQSVLAPIFRERCQSRDLQLPLYTIHSKENKLVRIRAGVTPYLAQSLLRFRRGSRGARMLVEQLISFPIADHDDGPDALCGAIKLLTDIVEGRTRGEDHDVTERLEA